MKVPYNCLQPCGKVLFAARGGKIHSLSLQDGTHVSTWKHPDVERVAAAAGSKVQIEVSSSVPTASSAAASDENGPPAKRQRLQSTKEDENDGEAMVIDEPHKQGEQQQGEQQEEEKSKKKNRMKGNKAQGKQKQQQQQQNNRGAFARVPDYPVITLMTTTSDGSHLLAISGHDKCLWVFEHDGEGNLKELSQRQMPKRPCSVVICPDNKTILSADKFGDVFSLPLVPYPKPVVSDKLAASAETSEPTSSNSTPAAPSGTAAPKPFKPEANNFTVHSKSNLRALSNQKREMKKAKRDVPKDDPTFEHTLQIGHVSMLTALTLAEKGSRRYIITADRDEHIRVSRYMPHAHVIEGFCLGHSNFVSALALTSQDVLISGGGDAELFVWDWEAGRILSKFDLLKQVRQVEKDAAKVAVSQLLAATVIAGGQPVSIVLAVCESIPAVFVLRISEQSILVHHQTVLLPGNPLHVAHLPADGYLASILVTVDATEAPVTTPCGILSYKWAGASFSATEDFRPQDSCLAEGEFDLSPEQVRKLLYNVEDLRKKGDEHGEELGNDEQGAELAQDIA